MPVEWTTSCFSELTSNILNLSSPEEKENSTTNNHKKPKKKANSCTVGKHEAESCGVKKKNGDVDKVLQMSMISRDSLDNDDDDVKAIKSESMSGEENIGEVKKDDDDDDDKNGGGDYDDDDSDDDKDDVNLDMHSLALSTNGIARNEITGEDGEAPMFTAEQVISEIEEMMEVGGGVVVFLLLFL